LLIAFGSVISIFSLKYRNSEQVRPAVGAKTWLQILLLIIVGLNSLAPYLGVKTNATMTMFSNLKIEGGVTNHLIMPRLPFETPADDLVAVISSSNPNVRTFKETGLLYTWHELRRKMSETPGASISYERHGEVFEYKKAHENPELVSINPVLHKLTGFRNASVTDECLW
jgi:hypothetical protein